MNTKKSLEKHQSIKNTNWVSYKLDKLGENKTVDTAAADIK